MDFKLGFIGCGNMAQGILKGIFAAGEINAENISVYDADPEKMEHICSLNDKVSCCGSEDELAKNSDMVFLCVKPNIQSSVIKAISDRHRSFISIAAGITSLQLAENLGTDSRYLRIMPNTPLTVGLGATCFSRQNNLTSDEYSFVKSIFEATGIVCEVDEKDMGAVTGVSGSGPAYVYYFIDAMTNAGCEQGLSYDDSLRLTLQTIKGSVKMVELSEKTPSQLKKDVCSPGGTTIEALKVFDDNRMEDIIMRGIDACVKKSRILSEKNNV